MKNNKDRSNKIKINNLPVLQTTSSYVSYGGELNLSNLGQMELLCAIGERGVPLRIMVSGSSMHPFIKNQDVLTIAPIIDQGFRVGEVVAFILPGSRMLAIHRIVAKKANLWLIKGDNNALVDGLVPNEDILGKVFYIERQGREVRIGFRFGITSYLIALVSLHNLLSPILKLVFSPLKVVRFLRK